MHQILVYHIIFYMDHNLTPKLTTTVYIFYLIPGTRPRISSSSMLFRLHIGRHLKTRIEEVVFQSID